jgi:hypothetical protein
MAIWRCGSFKKPGYRSRRSSGRQRSVTHGSSELDSELGTIEPGKIANLVLLKKSPLESVDAYDSITAVWVQKKSSLARQFGSSFRRLNLLFRRAVTAERNS